MDSSPHAVLGSVRSILSGRHGDEPDDRELLRRFLDKHEDDAFAALLRRHGPMVLGLARRVVGDGQLAEDVIQAAFLLLARRAHTIRKPEALPCWLHGVAFRLALRVRRSRHRHQERESRVRRPHPPTPLDELTAREFLSVLDEELQNLPENYRAPLILCCLEGLSQDEAAKRLGCSAGAVKGRLERGRTQLRLRLVKRGLMLPTVFGGALLIAGSVQALPPALVQSTMHAARTGFAGTPAVAALMDSVLRSLFFRQLRAIIIAVVLLGVAARGIGLVTTCEDEQIAQPPISAMLPEKPKARGQRTDLYGDPLPPGAFLRLGTLQRRAVGARLAVSADGKTIVGVRGRKYLHIWDADTGKLRQTRELPGEGLNRPLVLSSDGRLLASNGETEGNDRLAIWDVQTGQRLQTLTLRGAQFIYPMAFSPDGKRIAAIGGEQSGNHGAVRFIRIWDIASGKEIFGEDIRDINQNYLLTFSPDGKHLLASFNNSEGTYCCCWDIANGQQIWQNKDNIWHYTMVFTPDGQILTSQQPSGQGLRAVDLATGQAVPLAKAPPIDWHTRLALTPDGRTLLLSTAEGAIVWDRVRGEQRGMLAGAGEEMVIMPDGKSVITNNGALQRWDLATGKATWTDTFALGHVGEVVSLAFSADGTRLASAATDGTVRLWDTKTGKPLRLWRGHTVQRPIMTSAWMAAAVKTVDITPNGDQILSAGSDEHIRLWDARADTRSRLLTLPGREQGEGERTVFRVQLNAEGTRAVALFGSVGFDLKLSTWDLKTGELSATHSVETARAVDIWQAQSITIAPDGRTLLIEGALVDAARGQEIARFEDGMSNPRTFSRDGALAAGGCTRASRKEGRTISTADGAGVWETATGRRVAHLKTKSLIGLLAFHPDHRLVAASTRDGILLWDALTGKEIATLQMPESIRSARAQASYASCLAFAPDGRRLATGHPDGTILLWDVPTRAGPSGPTSVRELEMLWADLADADAARAWRAVWRMSEAPNEAVAFLHGRVKPAPSAPVALMRKLLADLDGDSFEGREAAVKRLKELGVQAEPALRAALQAKPSLEQKRRIESLLAELAVPATPTPEELRQLRALVVLERVGSPQARRMLEVIANGPRRARFIANSK